MATFADKIIAWQKLHGRHDLPWQSTRNIATDPYAIWVSEVMLQQTQVAAVIGYYAKFMQRFPTIAALANSSQEEVLQSWSGLGYYSRARSLHNAAQKIIDEFSGIFPTQFNDILSLPGIGRSTAAAISTFALSTPQPILDGNVKRVFARHFNIAGWPSAPKIEQQMWQIAVRENPAIEAVAYTQGLMDLGATLCTRTKPECGACPVSISCEALEKNLVHALPTPKPRKVIPEKNTTMLVLMNGDEVMLEKRPPTGIWGGLWSFPEINIDTKSDDINLQNASPLNKLTHTFTHFKLHIQPLLARVTKQSWQVEEPRTIWLSLDDAIGAAIPTPIRKILQNLKIKKAA
ncbi:MAG: A/G-specific adenine glycosylase [Methylotenera sp.]